MGGTCTTSRGALSRPDIWYVGRLFGKKALTMHMLYHVLDHYGRGYSEAPETEYTANFYTTQLALLMQHLGWSQAHIVGVSMVCSRILIGSPCTLQT